MTTQIPVIVMTRLDDDNITFRYQTSFKGLKRDYYAIAARETAEDDSERAWFFDYSLHKSDGNDNLDGFHTRGEAIDAMLDIMEEFYIECWTPEDEPWTEPRVKLDLNQKEFEAYIG
jgi:hypothetical protein